MTSELPDAAITTQTGAASSTRKRTPPTRRSAQRSIGGAAQDADGARLSLKKGQFLRDYRTYCASPQAEIDLAVLQACAIFAS